MPAAKRAKSTLPPWQEWIDGLWRSLSTRMDRRDAGLVLMEQRLHRSSSERVCAQCGDAAPHERAGGGWGPFACVRRYFLCDECHAYFGNKEV